MKSKERKGKQITKNKTKRKIGRVQGQVRWPFGPPHLTLNLQKKNQTTKKQNKKTKIRKENKIQKQNTKNTKKELFSYQSNFSFLVGVQNFLFWHLGPKNAQPKNTLKGVSARFFWKADVRHETAIFGPKKPKPEIPVISFFALIFSFNNKKHKKLLKPLFL